MSIKVYAKLTSTVSCMEIKSITETIIFFLHCLNQKEKNARLQTFIMSFHLKNYFLIIFPQLSSSH